LIIEAEREAKVKLPQARQKKKIVPKRENRGFSLAWIEESGLARRILEKGKIGGIRSNFFEKEGGTLLWEKRGESPLAAEREGGLGGRGTGITPQSSRERFGANSKEVMGVAGQVRFCLARGGEGEKRGFRLLTGRESSFTEYRTNTSALRMHSRGVRKEGRQNSSRKAAFFGGGREDRLCQSPGLWNREREGKFFSRPTGRELS